MSEYQCTSQVEEAVRIAQSIAGSGGFEETGTEHLLGAFLFVNCNAANRLNKMGVTRERLGVKYDGATSHRLDFSARARRAFNHAAFLAASIKSAYINAEVLLLGILADRESLAYRMLLKHNIDAEHLVGLLCNDIGIEYEPGLQSKQSVHASNAVAANISNDVMKFGTDLTKRAAEGILDPVIGRYNEIERVIQVLSRRTKNNPMLIGEAGVGKSAVVEGLAQEIIENRVPDLLKGKTVFSLDIAGILAGTRYRGDFEERLKKLIDTIINDRNIILFIDEIHNIVGAGGSSEGKFDAAEMLKPLLARGELQTIGATTFDEYRRFIEKDPALERRFQPVVIEQPSVEDTIRILHGLKFKYEKHHGITITDSAIEAAAKLSDRYIADRQLPDKAIDVIDEACSRARLNLHQPEARVKRCREQYQALEKSANEASLRQDFESLKKIREEMDVVFFEYEKLNEKVKARTAQIDSDDIAEVVSAWTLVPVAKINESEAQKLMRLESVLHSRVIGQNEAVNAVARAIRRNRAGLKDPSRPVGSFIFLGPTGVGKTELAKALAESVFGDENLMIRLDMSEYMEKQSTSKIIGAPPGYVGYDDGGGLTEKVRKRPYSVILFDEIEKAHPDIMNIMLQVLDEGRLTDSKGRTVSFKNTIIIMTSNLGVTSLQKNETNSYEEMKERLLHNLRGQLKPEFINRIDDVIVFHYLTKEDSIKIAGILASLLANRMRSNGTFIYFTEKAVEHLALKGYDAEYGARPLKRTIQREVEDKLSEAVLTGEIKRGAKIIIDCADNSIVFYQG